jgi:PPOX class probable F420-dependent enzyme
MSPSSDLEVLRSLLDAAAPAVLLTYRADGSADMSPVWFRVAGEMFEVVVAKSDKKYGHLQRDRRAVLMVFEAVPPFRGVKVRAEVELDDAGVEEARRVISARYLGAETAEDFVAAREAGVVVLLPTSAARVWDLAGILPETR